MIQLIITKNWSLHEKVSSVVIMNQQRRSRPHYLFIYANILLETPVLLLLDWIILKVFVQMFELGI